jgi:hypothetical protein
LSFRLDPKVVGNGGARANDTYTFQKAASARIVLFLFVAIITRLGHRSSLDKKTSAHYCSPARQLLVKPFLPLEQSTLD